MTTLRLTGKIFYLGAAALIVLLLLVVAGCGGDEQAADNSITVQCEDDAPSIIPASTGRPQYAFFFSPT